MYKNFRVTLTILVISALCGACNPSTPPVPQVTTDSTQQPSTALAENSTKDMLLGGVVGAAAGYMLASKSQPLSNTVTQQATVVHKTTIINNYKASKPSPSRPTSSSRRK